MTLLNVSPEQLENSDGSITCEHCQTRFSASIDVTKADDHSSNSNPIIDENTQATLRIEALQPQPQHHRFPLRWLFLSLLLSLLLAGQYTYFKRNELAGYNALRPLLQTFCNILQCELKLLRDTSQIRIISREVRSHPSINNALQISLTLKNEAVFRQPWPTLQLAFSDINGQTIAQRSFPPQDYLPVGSSLSDGMPSQVPVHTNLVLIDPGKNAVNFVFEFF